jgi:hypothetical protein
MDKQIVYGCQWERKAKEQVLKDTIIRWKEEE